jgi:hypothetical protein
MTRLDEDRDELLPQEYSSSQFVEPKPSTKMGAKKQSRTLFDADVESGKKEWDEGSVDENWDNW